MSVADLGDSGYSGGLLVLDALGRPIEFHCSVPIVPDRAQRILYGRTLESFIYCDQIAVSLLEKCQLDIGLWIFNQADLLELHDLKRLDCVSVLQDQEESTTRKVTDTAASSKFDSRALDADGDGRIPSYETIEFMSRKFRVPSNSSFASDTWKEKLEHFRPIDFLDEPFERIAEAISEAYAVCA